MTIIKAPTSRDIVYNGTHGDLSCAMAYVEMEHVSSGDVVKVLDLPLGLELTELKFMHDLLATADSLEFFLYTSSYEKIPLGRKTRLGGSPQVEIKNIDMTLEEPAALCFVYNPTTTLDKVIVGEIGGIQSIVKATNFRILQLNVMHVGDNQTAAIDKMSITPPGATLKIEWSSDNAAVATINKITGQITASGLGSAHIIAKDTYTGKSMKAIVDVRFNYSTLPLTHPDYQYVVVPAHSSNGWVTPVVSPASPPDASSHPHVDRVHINTSEKEIVFDMTSSGFRFSDDVGAEVVIFDIKANKAIKKLNYVLKEGITASGDYIQKGSIDNSDIAIYQDALKNELIALIITTVYPAPNTTPSP